MADLMRRERYFALPIGRSYARAPISEAVLEFRVEPTSDDISRLAEMNFGTEYERPTPMYHASASLQHDDDDLRVESQRDQVGYVYASEKTLVQATAHSFAFIARAPYEGWDCFSDLAEQAWSVYRDSMAPAVLSRIGVRYVNQIALPAGRPIEIKDYMRTSVDVSAYLPQALKDLFMQIDVPLPELDAVATVTSALLERTDEHPGGGLLLDIDVKSVVNLSVEDEGFSVSLDAVLDRMRFAKNYVFEACITDATRGLIG